MLADKDRIFTNLYGWRLKAAEARGEAGFPTGLNIMVDANHDCREQW